MKINSSKYISSNALIELIIDNKLSKVIYIPSTINALIEFDKKLRRVTYRYIKYYLVQ